MARDYSILPLKGSLLRCNHQADGERCSAQDYAPAPGFAFCTLCQTPIFGEHGRGIREAVDAHLRMCPTRQTEEYRKRQRRERD